MGESQVTEAERASATPAEDPMRPFTEILGIFHTMAETGGIEPSTPADDDAPGPGSRVPADEPITGPDPADSDTVTTGASAEHLADLQAVIDAATAALARIEGEPVPDPVPDRLDPAALAELLAGLEPLAVPPPAPAAPAPVVAVSEPDLDPGPDLEPEPEVDLEPEVEPDLPPDPEPVPPPPPAAPAPITPPPPPPPPRLPPPEPRADAATAVLTALARQRADEEAATQQAETSADSSSDPAPAASRPTVLTLLRPDRMPGKLVAGAVVVALMAGTGWFITRGPLAHPTDEVASDVTAEPTPSQPSVEIAPHQADYAAVVSAVRSATDLTSLAAAADQATDLVQLFSTLKAPNDVGQRLINAEAAALQAFSALDALTAENASAQFPALMPLVRTSATAVAAARKRLPGSDPSTDTAPAASHVVTLVAPLALAGLTQELRELVTRAGKATKTAGLREVAADAFGLRISAEDTAAILGTRGKYSARAAVLHDAAESIVSMKTIDADHLDQWTTTTGPRLHAQLGDLDLPTAPIDAVDEMIDAATLVMKAWTELHDVPDKADLSAYRSKVVAAMRTWTKAWASVPDVDASQKPDFALTTRFYKASKALEKAAGAMDRVAVPKKAPDALADANAALVALARRARAAAVAGHQVALAAEDCGESCTYGQQKGWKNFRAAVDAIGTGAGAKASWQAAYDAALAQAADTADLEKDKPDV